MNYNYGLYFMSLAYVLAGMNHFRAPTFYLPMMPPWIPRHGLMIALSGIAEIALGLGLLIEPLRAFAAWSIVLMLLVFFSVHIYMLQARNTVFKKVPLFVLVARIPLQFLLIYWSYLYT